MITGSHRRSCRGRSTLYEHDLEEKKIIFGPDLERSLFYDVYLGTRKVGNSRIELALHLEGIISGRGEYGPGQGKQVHGALNSAVRLMSLCIVDNDTQRLPGASG